jgi:hypothetical protein
MREFLTCKLLLELNKELPAFFFLSSFGQSDQYLFLPIDWRDGCGTECEKNEKRIEIII